MCYACYVLSISSPHPYLVSTVSFRCHILLLLLLVQSESPQGGRTQGSTGTGG